MDVSFENLPLSKEGKIAMKENGVTVEDLYTFTEGDILDIFKIFQDRRLVRKLIQDISVPTSTHLNSSFSSANTSMEMESDFDQEVDQGQIDLKTVCEFSADELLQKKSLRGQSSDAQKYFNTLMKDAAKAANIWKKAPTLDSIGSKKKEIFLKVCIDHAPCLETRKNDLWQRIGQHLQNRRKYLRDKLAGKRKHKCKHPVDLESSKPDVFKAGDEVVIKKQNLVYGKGIFMGYKNGSNKVYSKVILKSKTNTKDTGQNFELPEKAPDGAVDFESAGLKQIITLKSSDILMEGSCKGQNKKTVKPTSTVSRASVEKNESSDSSESENESNPRLTSNTSSEKSDSDLSDVDHGRTNSKRKANPQLPGKFVQPSEEKKWKTNVETSQVPTGRSAQPMKARQNETENSLTTDNRDFSFVLMEWARGSLYWGVRRPSPNGDDNFIVRNCGKPCFKLNKDNINLELGESFWEITKNAVLSGTDVQLNPDMTYCILEIQKCNKFLTCYQDSSDPKYKHGIVKVDEDQKCNFLKKVSDALNAYVKSC